MKKILVFGASTSSTSINQQLAEFAASKVKGVQTDIVKLSDFYPMEMFDVDYEREYGYPENAIKLHELMSQYDGFIISLAEHNGSYTAAFKNALDWTSRMQGNTFFEQPVLILGTSPGKKGAQFVIAAGVSRFPWNGAKEVTDSFSLPEFDKNFDKEQGITDGEKLKELEGKIAHFLSKL